MKNIDLLVDSLEFIEAHLNEDMKTADIAEFCHCSKSTLEKLFQNINRISVHGYIIRRRMMLAARRIATQPDESILQIAVEYGYSSHEAFTRAFKDVWNCNPSEFRGKKFTELYPRAVRPINLEGDDYVMRRKQVDISELYDLFKERKDCYFVCCDIKSLVPINEIAHKAGDLAILETMNRMNNAAGEEDMVFRIGGDEFCMLTDSTSLEYAEGIVKEILSHNGEVITYNGQDIPLNLYAIATKFSGEQLKYDKLFRELHDAIKVSKE